MENITMKVEIKNSILGKAIELLYEMELAGKRSRHRTRFIQQLSDRLELLSEEELILLKDYCELDEEGNPKMVKKDERQEYVFKDVHGFVKEQEELFDESMVIEGEDNKVMLVTVREALDECETAYSGEDATLYEYLCKQFKVDENLEEIVE